MEDGTVRGTGIRLPTENKDVRVRLISSGTDDCVARIGLDGRLYTEQSYQWLNTDEERARADVARARKVYSNGAFLMMITEGGRVLAARDIGSGCAQTPFPDFNRWTDVTSLALRSWWTGGGGGSQAYREMFIAIKKDGTLYAFPKSLQKIVGGWRDVADVCIADGFLLALRKDGSCRTAAISPEMGSLDAPVPDVSSWRGIQKIAVLGDAAVGLTAAGTLVFAGNHSMWRD